MIYNSAIISIGNELLLGRTLNSNLAWLGMQLAELGFPVLYSETIPDSPEAIREALDYCWQKFDVLITTGGLGPTQDDLTRDSIAGFFGSRLGFDDDVWQHINALFAYRNVPLPDSNRCQAMVPEGFSVLKNDRGTAPGLHFSASGKHFFALQGVPLEMRYVFDAHVRSILKSSFADLESIVVKNIHTYGVGESTLAEMINIDKLPRTVNLAWLPQTGRVDLRLYGEDSAAISTALEYIKEIAGSYIWAYDELDPASHLLAILKEKKYCLAVAESCTGGLVQRFLTDVPGASEHFLGGIVSYANSIKTEVLGVPTGLLEDHGAVSEECARAMALGVQKLCKSDVALAITGIAGPDGGTAEKPVGTVYYSWCIKQKQYSVHKIFTGDRNSIRHKAAEAAILELSNSLRELEI